MRTIQPSTLLKAALAVFLFAIVPIGVRADSNQTRRLLAGIFFLFEWRRDGLLRQRSGFTCRGSKFGSHRSVQLRYRTRYRTGCLR